MPRKIVGHKGNPKLPSFRGKLTETAGAVKRAAPDNHDDDDDEPEGSSKRPRVVSTSHAQDHDHGDIRYDDGDDHDNFNDDSGSIFSGDLDLDLGDRIGVVSLSRSTLTSLRRVLISMIGCRCSCSCPSIHTRQRRERRSRRLPTN